ncbi:hypothetical protein [Falsirhodobacter halotolerans]|uniref:hypothetical protein n=1 Tax=Falsirhodobacter halotolerans TaxID=1146892 RepID=UPI001FD262BC|nr:hypothetical protein [Falsirhodobacter halotolerans]MCJ8139592.1 hypothetical protein [Falsirhodobacter halotolerans]
MDILALIISIIAFVIAGRANRIAQRIERDDDLWDETEQEGHSLHTLRSMNGDHPAKN